MQSIQHSVFVIMPYGSASHSRFVYDRGIKPVVEALGLVPRRVDRETLPDSIGARIRAQIADSCIADLSFARPNCYYEIGYAHALGKPV
jgi:hypothetical protein